MVEPKEAAETAGTVLKTGMSIGKDIAKALPTHRRCKVEITNECSSYTLCGPRVHIESGRCSCPAPAIIPPSETREMEFSKTVYTAHGANGIFTFNVLNNSTKESTEKIAVMYKVPFNFKSKSNEYALGVFSISRECNRDLFHEMSKNTNTTFVRGEAKGPSLTYKSDTVKVMATMSDCHQPVMKVQVSDI